MHYRAEQLARLDLGLARLVLGADAGSMAFAPTRVWSDVGILLASPLVTDFDPRIEWDDSTGIWTVRIERGGLFQAERKALAIAICCAVAAAHRIHWLETDA